MLATGVTLFLASCVHTLPDLTGRHSLLAVDDRLLPIDAGSLPGPNGSHIPYSYAAGHLELTSNGRFELHQEYRSQQTSQVVATQTQKGTYTISGDRILLRGDPQPLPSEFANSWYGRIRSGSIALSYGHTIMTFRLAGQR
jgi:hypothetical protein